MHPGRGARGARSATKPQTRRPIHDPPAAMAETISAHESRVSTGYLRRRGPHCNTGLGQKLLSSSGQIATVVAHSTVKVPSNNIKAVTLGGY
eukprot:5658615-Prymnesium_polylepis.1